MRSRQEIPCDGLQGSRFRMSLAEIQERSGHGIDDAAACDVNGASALDRERTGSRNIEDPAALNFDGACALHVNGAGA